MPTPAVSRPAGGAVVVDSVNPYSTVRVQYSCCRVHQCALIVTLGKSETYSVHSVCTRTRTESYYEYCTVHSRTFQLNQTLYSTVYRVALHTTQSSSETDLPIKYELIRFSDISKREQSTHRTGDRSNFTQPFRDDTRKHTNEYRTVATTRSQARAANKNRLSAIAHSYHYRFLLVLPVIGTRNNFFFIRLGSKVGSAQARMPRS